MNGITILTSPRPSSVANTAGASGSVGVGVLSPPPKSTDPSVAASGTASSSTSTTSLTSAAASSNLLSTPIPGSATSMSSSTSISTSPSSTMLPPHPPTLNHSASGEVKAVSFSLPPIASSAPPINFLAPHSPLTAEPSPLPSSSDPNTLEPGKKDDLPELTDTERAQLVEALRSSKDRIWLLRVGESMERLFSTSGAAGPKKVEFNPPTTYQRMLVHRCATLYRLLPESDGAGKTIVVSLTATSRIPKTRLQDLVPSEETPQVTFQIMRRSGSSLRRGGRSQSSGDGGPPSVGSSSGTVFPSGIGAGGTDSEDLFDGDGERSEAGSSSTTSKSKRMTIAEREAAYEAARSRIFGDEQSGSKAGSSGSLPLPGSAGGGVSPAGSDVGRTGKAGSFKGLRAASPVTEAGGIDPAVNAPAPTDEEYDPAYDPARRGEDEQEEEDVPRPSVPFPSLYNPNAPSQPQLGPSPASSSAVGVQPGPTDPTTTAAAAVAAGYPIFQTYLQPIPVPYPYFPAAGYGFPAPGYAPGMPGVAGVPGMTGMQGAQGMQGMQGVQGVNGVAGVGYYASPYGGPYMWVAQGVAVPGAGGGGMQGMNGDLPQSSQPQQQQQQLAGGEPQVQQMGYGAYGYGGMGMSQQGYGMPMPGTVQQQQQQAQQPPPQHAQNQGLGQGMQHPFMMPHQQGSAGDPSLTSMQMGYPGGGAREHPFPGQQQQRGANGKHTGPGMHPHPHAHQHPHQHQPHPPHGHHSPHQRAPGPGQWAGQQQLPPPLNLNLPVHNGSLPGGKMDGSSRLNVNGQGMQRNAWSYGPGVGGGLSAFDRPGGGMGGMGGVAMGMMGGRMGARSISGMSNGSGSGSGSRTPLDDGSSTVSSSTSSSSRATYTSIGSGRHPLPARPDWAIGLHSPASDMVGDLRPTSAMSTSSGVSTASLPRSVHGPQHRGSGLATNDFPPLGRGAPVQQKTQLGAWSGGSRAVIDAAHSNSAQQQGDDPAFVRPGGKAGQELFDPSKPRSSAPGGLRPAGSPAPVSPPNGSTTIVPGTAASIIPLNLVPRQATPTQNGAIRQTAGSVAAVDGVMSEVLARLKVSEDGDGVPAQDGVGTATAGVAV